MGGILVILLFVFVISVDVSMDVKSLISWWAGRVVDETFPPAYVPHIRGYVQPKRIER